MIFYSYVRLPEGTGKKWISDPKPQAKKRNSENSDLTLTLHMISREARSVLSTLTLWAEIHHQFLIYSPHVTWRMESEHQKPRDDPPKQKKWERISRHQYSSKPAFPPVFPVFFPHFPNFSHLPWPAPFVTQGARRSLMNFCSTGPQVCRRRAVREKSTGPKPKQSTKQHPQSASTQLQHMQLVMSK